MQGLPVNLLTQNAANAVKADGKSTPVSVDGKTGETKSADGKSLFASLFSGLLGGDVEAAEVPAQALGADGKPVATKGEGKTSTTAAESKVDVLLKSKDQEKNKKTEVTAMSTDKAMPADVLKSIQNLLATQEAPVTEKLAATSTGLEQLLKSLKGDKTEVIEDAEGENSAPVKDAKNTKGSPLDFLMKESKGNNVGKVSTEESVDQTMQSNPEAVSKLGLSSEDFLSHLGRAQESKESKGLAQMGVNGEMVDPKDIQQKQMNQSLKGYGQKQNLINDGGIIKNTKDLAFKDGKTKASSDELKTPDMKIGADLSMVKEQFIPVMQKQEGMAQNSESQNAGKVLDLSKINTSNTTEIIKRISDYVEQSQVANKDSLDLTVKHDSLGQFKIQVNRPVGPDAKAMDMQITTSSKEGHDFFVKNEIGLMKNLSQAGIQLSDLRIVSGSESMGFTQSDSKQSGNSQYGQAPKEFMSFDSGDSSQGSQKRRELWQEARANQQRYGA